MSTETKTNLEASIVVEAAAPISEVVRLGASKKFIGEFPLKSILADESFNVRKDYGDMDSLKESIAACGVSQPVVLRERDDGSVHLVCGHRRVRACNELGMESIPAVVWGGISKEVDAVLLNFQENVVRQNLNPMEEADGAARLRELGMDDSEICKHLGWSKTALTQRTNLLGYSAIVQSAVREGKLSVRQAAAITQLPDNAQPDFIARADTMTVSALTMAVREELDRLAGLHNSPPASISPASGDVEDEELAESTPERHPIDVLANTLSRLEDLAVYMLTDVEGSAEQLGAAKLLIGSLDLSPLSQSDLTTLHDVLYRLLSARGAVGIASTEIGDGEDLSDGYEDNADQPANDDVEDAVIRPHTHMLSHDAEDPDAPSYEDVTPPPPPFVSAPSVSVPARANDFRDDTQDDDGDEDESGGGREGSDAAVDVFLIRAPKMRNKRDLLKRYLMEDLVSRDAGAEDDIAGISEETPLCVAEGVSLGKARSITERYRATGATVVAQPST